MVAYSIIMFAAAAVLLAVSILVFRGNIQLIHSYHRERVTDEYHYGRAMGKALGFISLPLIAAGIVALFSASFAPTAVLLAGIPLSLIPLLCVQKKYNGGLF